MSPPKEDLEWNEVGLKYSNGDKPKVGDLIRYSLTPHSNETLYFVLEVGAFRIYVFSLRYKTKYFISSNLIDYELVQRIKEKI